MSKVKRLRELEKKTKDWLINKILDLEWELKQQKEENTRIRMHFSNKEFLERLKKMNAELEKSNAVLESSVTLKDNELERQNGRFKFLENHLSRLNGAFENLSDNILVGVEKVFFSLKNKLYEDIIDEKVNIISNQNKFDNIEKIKEVFRIHGLEDFFNRHLMNKDAIEIIQIILDVLIKKGKEGKHDEKHIDNDS